VILNVGSFYELCWLGSVCVFVCMCVCMGCPFKKKESAEKNKGFLLPCTVSFEAKTGHPVQIGVSLDKWRPAHNKLIIWYRAKQ
jgi:hypothetical protein